MDETKNSCKTKQKNRFSSYKDNLIVTELDYQFQSFENTIFDCIPKKNCFGNIFHIIFIIVELSRSQNERK